MSVPLPHPTLRVLLATAACAALPWAAPAALLALLEDFLAAQSEPRQRAS